MDLPSLPVALGRSSQIIWSGNRTRWLLISHLLSLIWFTRNHITPDLSASKAFSTLLQNDTPEFAPISTSRRSRSHGARRISLQRTRGETGKSGSPRLPCVPRIWQGPSLARGLSGSELGSRLSPEWGSLHTFQGAHRHQESGRTEAGCPPVDSTGRELCKRGGLVWAGGHSPVLSSTGTRFPS